MPNTFQLELTTLQFRIVRLLHLAPCNLQFIRANEILVLSVFDKPPFTHSDLPANISELASFDHVDISTQMHYINE